MSDKFNTEQRRRKEHADFVARLEALEESNRAMVKALAGFDRRFKALVKALKEAQG